MDEECLRVSRWLVIGLIALGAVLSYQVQVRFGSVFEAFQTFLSFFQGALFSLLLFRMLTRGPRGPAAWRACWWRRHGGAHDGDRPAVSLDRLVVVRRRVHRVF